MTDMGDQNHQTGWQERRGQQGPNRGRSRGRFVGSGRIVHPPDQVQQNRPHARNSQRGNTSNAAPTPWQRQGQRQNDGEERRKYNPFSFFNLQKLANSVSSNEVVHVLANPEYNFSDFIDNPLRVDIFCLLMKALSKVCHSDYDESKFKILSQICESNTFVGSLMTQIMQAESKSADERTEIVLNILTLFETVATLMPLTACDKLSSTITGCFFCCQGLVASNQIKCSQDDIKKFQNIVDSIALRKTETANVKTLKKESFQERRNRLEPPNDFREISLFPTAEDVLCTNDSVFLRANLVNGKYRDVNHYLDIQFRLLREDFIQPLREGIAAYISGDKDHSKTSVRIYNDVRFIRHDEQIAKVNASRKRDVEGILVNFDPKKKFKKIDWEHNRRFMYGALLCFSRNKFKTLIVGTICDRDVKNLEAGYLRVEFNQELEENFYKYHYVMIESEVFFEPYYRVLKTLQSLTEETFPLAEYIVHMQEDDYPPAYLEPQDQFQPVKHYTLKLEDNKDWPVIVTNPRSWPTHQQLDLDPSQFEALFGALTRELVVIQGPPGTGKTFMGLKIAEILIDNKAQTGRNCPILVVCLTNHALDQFLVGISKFTNKIIRIGGQSKCPEMTEYNLKVLRSRTKTRDQLKLIYKLREDIGRLKSEVTEFDACIKTLKSNLGVIAFEMLQDANVLPKEAIVAFNNHRFLMWLLDMGVDDARREVLAIGRVRFDVLLQEFDSKVEELEKLKIEDIRNVNLDVVNQQQAGLLSAKEWIQASLMQDQEESISSEDYNQWIHNLWRLNGTQKWQLYFYWIQCLEQTWLEEIRIRENEILKKNNEIQEQQIVDDLEILRESDVVGMTTTGAARLHTLLRKLGPEIVIVEEAAEVMESHVVACLTQRCTHLILIGDHKQLRPQVATYNLQVKYDFDVSLFERMVLNRGKCLTLGVQHRMHPDIASLVTPSIYEKLRNAESVFNYPEIPGLPKRLFFITHKHPEEMVDKDANSRINVHEAKFCLALCRHLVLQGIAPSKITILTTYKGQLFYIRKEMKSMQRLQEVLVTVVDNYQGEENDIVILSLVRSNKEFHTGFLKTENRVCVALSRAKHGLYIIGDMQCLISDPKAQQNNNIWIKMKDTLEKQEAIGDALPLRCQAHLDQRFSVKNAHDFAVQAPEGGCLERCMSMLLCGHECGRTCHLIARDHVDAKCLQPCGRLCESNLHICKKQCYETCGDCTIDVLKTLPCGHKKMMKCHVDVNSIKCEVIVEKMFNLCGHEAKVKCYVNEYEDPCPCDCDWRLDCGHSCTKKCHPKDDEDHLQYVCMKPCGRLNKGCSLNHECGKLCCNECSDCIQKVSKQRSCGHSHFMKCCTDPESIACHEKCTKVLPCRHACKKKCSEPCNPCFTKVTKVSDCGHEVKMKCGEKPSREYCSQPCQNKLVCGHPCTSTCNKPCTSRCLVEVSQAHGPCGHMVPLLCWEYRSGLRTPSNSSRCNVPCETMLECEHKCAGTCGTCHQGRFHSLCDKPCGRVLVCGHSCKEPCAEMCPPCKENCTFACEHSKCNKKCGEPCVSCKERCTWQCQHKRCKKRCGELCDRDPCDEPCSKKLRCGHGCIGFCGEPCPKHCRICHKQELTVDFFLLGFEDEEDARFVYLEDCGHSIEVQGMDHWMEQKSDMIAKKACPRCTATINQSRRFGTQIKRSFEDICKVKNKNFGNTSTIEKKRKELQDIVMVLLADLDTECKFDQLEWVLQACVKSLAPKIDGRKNVLSSTSVRCREIEVDVIQHVCEVWRRSKKMNLPLKERNDLKPHISFILDNLEGKKHRLSQQQVNDFNLEILRLQQISQYLAYRNVSTTRPDLNPLLSQFERLVLDSPSRNTTAKNNAAQQIFDQLKEKCKSLPGLGISEYERVQIINALKLQQGHWFRCPNGHPYIITECGGAMQEARCPVDGCGAGIGGGSHRLRSDNSLFREMDNSTHAAWSDIANMANYGNFDN